MNSNDYIRLDHGSGGTLTHNLIRELFLPNFINETLKHLDDSAVLQFSQKRIAFTTDSYIVDPLFFPGGDIGTLAVCGTINDIAMSGALPLYLSAGFIIEEGFSVHYLEKIVLSMKKTVAEANIEIVTGDTKVVPKGGVDKLFINTAGLGVIPDSVPQCGIGSRNALVGDEILINGYIGDHGIAVLSQREGLQFQTGIKSDVAPVHELVKSLLENKIEIHTLRDPTRGGLATSLNEIAERSNVGIALDEEKIPVRNEVVSACDILGFDPLYIANEGKCIAVVPGHHAQKALELMRNHEHGNNAAIIGEVTAEHRKKVTMRTSIGGRRVVDMLTGEQLPRIC